MDGNDLTMLRAGTPISMALQCPGGGIVVPADSGLDGCAV